MFGFRRLLLLLPIALVLLGSTLGPSAARVSAGPTAPNPVDPGFLPRSIAFVDANRGVVAGTIVCRTCARTRTAAIAVTADGGRTWGAPITFARAAATDLTWATGTTNVWTTIGSAGGGIRSRLATSSDGGATWSLLPSTGIWNASFATADLGWALTNGPGGTLGVARTSDGGMSWDRLRKPCRGRAPSASSVSRTTADHGWVVCIGEGAAGSALQAIWETADGGSTWQRRSRRFTIAPRGYQFLDDGRGWRWHDVTSQLFGTADGGRTWRDLGAIVSREVHVDDVWFVSNGNGFAIVDLPRGSLRLVSTPDGGRTWSTVTTFPKP